MIEFHKFLQSQIGNSKNFTWAEALFLKEWQLHVMPEHPDVIKNIEKVAEKMQLIRDFLKMPTYVLSWYRPLSYNEHIGGAKRSNHLFGMACDFGVVGLDADTVRALLAPKLSEFNIRMERLDNSSWVHIDINCDDKTPQEKRYFLP